MYFNKNRKQNDINISSVTKTDGSSNVITKTDSLVATSITTNTINATGTIKITNNNPVIQLVQADVVKGTAPTIVQWVQGLQFKDKNGITLSGIESGFKANMENRINLICYPGTTSDNSSNENVQISTGFDKNGKWFTYAPTPDLTDKSTKIATTAWVRNFASSTEFNTIINNSINVDHIVATPKAASWIGALKVDYGAIINSNASTFGAVFNAPTKNYKVALATYPGQNDNVYLYSATKTNVTKQSPNSSDYSIYWNASNGLLTGNGLSFGTGTITNLTSTNENTKYVKINATHDTIGTAGLVIGGGKQNYAIAIQNTNMTKGGPNPSANQSSGIEFYGKDRDNYKHRFGLLQQKLSTTNTNVVGIYAYDHTSKETTTTAAITVNVDNSGNRTVTTNVPVPANTDNTTKLATTQFVQNVIKSKLATTIPSTVGTSATAKTGTSTLFARADHIHNFSFPKSDSDEFKNVMKNMIESLHIQYFCSDAGIPKTFYVNGKTGTDNADTHGITLAKPWKTIAFAIKEVCTNYNISNQTVIIKIVNSVTYNETLIFPNYNRTTGMIYVRGVDANGETLSGENRVTISRSINNGGNTVYVSENSVYEFQHINFKLNQSDKNDTNTHHFPSAFYADNGSKVTLNQCQFTFVDNANTSGKLPQVRLVDLNGAKVNLTGGGRFVLPSTKKSHIVVLYVTDNSNLLTQKRNDINLIKYYVSGKFDTFILIAYNSYYRYYGSLTYHPAFIEVANATSTTYKAGACTGKRYSISWSSWASVNACKVATHSIEKSKADYFPGNSAGSVDTQSYYE